MGEKWRMYLEVKTDTWQVNERRNAGCTQFLRIANTRSLEDERGAHGAAGNDNLLPGTIYNRLVLLARVQVFGRNGDHSHSAVVIKDDLINLGITFEEEVPLVAHGAVDVGMSRVGATTGIAAVHMSGPRTDTVNGLTDLIHLSQCSAPWPVVRSCRSSVMGMPWDSAARRKSCIMG